jgi:hypothetical protein
MSLDEESISWMIVCKENYITNIILSKFSLGKVFFIRSKNQF